MKRLFLHIACITTVYSYGQLHNANWYFGDHAGFTFMTNPPSELTNMPLTNSFTTNEGCATISDEAGNLLFYTDGTTVFTHNHTQMDNGNGLMGHYSSAQNAIIVPRPGLENQFYIFTTGAVESSTNKGLYYSIVDMNLNNGYGEVVTKNIALKDHLGTSINSSYSYGTYIYEKITSSLCSDSLNYWMVTQVKNNIYSYKVTQNSVGGLIALQPDKVCTLPYTDMLQAGSFLKISPDGGKIATTHQNSGNNIIYKTGNFNTSTGEITNLTNNIVLAGVANPKEMEFSPNGTILYYSIEDTNFISRLYKYDFSTGQNQMIIQAGSDKWFSGIRLAIDGKIYICTGNFIAPYSLSVLNTPNNYSNPGFVYEAVPLTRNQKSGLPQLVNFQQQYCNSISLYSEVHSSYIYEYKRDITTLGNYTTPENSDIEMRASDFICFKPDTHIIYGTDFYAHGGLCSPIGTRMGQFQDDSEPETSELSESNEIYLYPNPLAAGNTLNISSNNSADKSVAIYDVLGKQVFAGTTNRGTVNTTDLKAGIYIVKVTEGDKTATRKLIVQ